MSESTAMRTRVQSSSAPLTMAVAWRVAGIARDSVAGTSPARVATTSRWPSRPATATAVDLDRPAAERVDRPVARRPARRPRSPRFQATRQPPGASSGKASSTSSASAATARAVTAGQRPRWRRSAARASARTAAASTVPARAPVAPRPRSTGSAAFLAIGSTSSARRGGQRGGERDARVAAARPEVEERVDAAVRAGSATRGQAVDDVARRRPRPGRGWRSG